MHSSVVSFFAEMPGPVDVQTLAEAYKDYVMVQVYTQTVQLKNNHYKATDKVRVVVYRRNACTIVENIKILAKKTKVHPKDIIMHPINCSKAAFFYSCAAFSHHPPQQLGQVMQITNIGWDDPLIESMYKLKDRSVYTHIFALIDEGCPPYHFKKYLTHLDSLRIAQHKMTQSYAAITNHIYPQPILIDFDNYSGEKSREVIKENFPQGDIDQCTYEYSFDCELDTCTMYDYLGEPNIHIRIYNAPNTFFFERMKQIARREGMFKNVEIFYINLHVATTMSRTDIAHKIIE